MAPKSVVEQTDLSVPPRNTFERQGCGLMEGYASVGFERQPQIEEIDVNTIFNN
jgi:hypothetical protein